MDRNASNKTSDLAVVLMWVLEGDVEMAQDESKGKGKTRSVWEIITAWYLNPESDLNRVNIYSFNSYPWLIRAFRKPFNIVFQAVIAVINVVLFAIETVLRIGLMVVMALPAFLDTCHHFYHFLRGKKHQHPFYGWQGYLETCGAFGINIAVVLANTLIRLWNIIQLAFRFGINSLTLSDTHGHVSRAISGSPTLESHELQSVKFRSDELQKIYAAIDLLAQDDPPTDSLDPYYPLILAAITLERQGSSGILKPAMKKLARLFTEDGDWSEPYDEALHVSLKKAWVTAEMDEGMITVCKRLSCCRANGDFIRGEIHGKALLTLAKLIVDVTDPSRTKALQMSQDEMVKELDQLFSSHDEEAVEHVMTDKNTLSMLIKLSNDINMKDISKLNHPLVKAIVLEVKEVTVHLETMWQKQNGSKKFIADMLENKRSGPWVIQCFSKDDVIQKLIQAPQKTLNLHAAETDNDRVNQVIAIEKYAASQIHDSYHWDNWHQAASLIHHLTGLIHTYNNDVEFSPLSDQQKQCIKKSLNDYADSFGNNAIESVTKVGRLQPFRAPRLGLRLFDNDSAYGSDDEGSSSSHSSKSTP